MPSTPPPGDPAPLDGALPDRALEHLADTPLGFYLHVPFCAVRCGYCDFNTYSPDQVDEDAVTVWARAAHAEIDLAARVLGARAPRLTSVFVGGGTPTLVPPALLTGLLGHLREVFGLMPQAEVTTEANPETITPAVLEALLAGGFTRLSVGMQSSVPHVLRVLDRVHTPGRALEAVRLARTAGFGDISLDLIYGTPGESMDDWRASVEAALSVEPDHLSAYSLIVEDGTALAARIRRGVIPAPDDDDLADKYLLAEDILSAAGFEWYEVSNWSRGGHRAQHNLAYWRSQHWWGVGPGAHSHVGGVRWWNVRHPRHYGTLLAEGLSPGEGREELDADERRVERVLLELRIAEGLPIGVLTATERARLPPLVDEGLLVHLPDDEAADARVALTLRGRLLADGVVRGLLD